MPRSKLQGTEITRLTSASRDLDNALGKLEDVLTDLRDVDADEDLQALIQQLEEIRDASESARDNLDDDVLKAYLEP
jgi:hypothetical protein